MYREDSAHKLIEYIRTLPLEDQELIAESILVSKHKAAKGKVRVSGANKISAKKMASFLNGLGHKLPKDYQFNRDEANER